MRVFRLLKIILTFWQYGLYEIILLNTSNWKHKFTISILRGVLFLVPQKQRNLNLASKVKLTLEELGPVFIKFGQLLSTRQDLIPHEFITELSKLQNQVKPFSGEIAKTIIARSLKKNIDELFTYFEDESKASASIAQVHQAILKDNNHYVAVKVRRPNIQHLINKDVKVLMLLAVLIEKFFNDGKRLRPIEVIEEFKKIITAELDFMQEAANATKLYRLHQNDSKIIIPKIYYDYCSNDVIIMEWMHGIKISELTELKKHNINLEQLSHNGVAIFYNQVFNYGFFHADMHPGNILCDTSGRYIALDFGIVGCLSDNDKRYLAINILAFFNRDYKKVAVTHVESGWAPKDTPIEELENAIRAVCEPIFNKPLSEISFGQILIKLFQVSRAFNIPVQPQLVLLQKTIINVEGLGRLLNPKLDLWVTAKPILEKWMREQMGIRGFIKNIKAELPNISYTLPRIPSIINQQISMIEQNNKIYHESHLKLLKQYKHQNQILLLIILILTITIYIKL